MKRILLIVPLLAGCATQRVASVNEVEVLRREVKALRQELGEVRNRNAYREFRRGRRVKAPTDRRNDLPKGVKR